MSAANSASGVGRLRELLRGQVVLPTDPEYDEARQVWNASIDKRPGAIAYCADVDDVVAVVRFAREAGVELAVRSGGHGIAGRAVVDEGVVLDLSRMKAITVDPATRTAQAQAGLTWGEFDAATQEHGLATTGGLIPSTGIAGLTLGGGIGWLMRKHGLACDNLLGADLVTAAGEVVRADAENNPDLYWGVRGGGGNFGVVTGMDYRLHPVGPAVLGGIMAYTLEQAPAAFRAYSEWTRDLPDEMTSMGAVVAAPPAPFVPPGLAGQPVFAVALCYAGEIESGQEVLRPLREATTAPAFDVIGPMPYLAVQGMVKDFAPPHHQNYWRSEYLAGLGDAEREVVLEYGAHLPSPLCQAHLQQLGGAVARVGTQDTAFAHRDAAFTLLLLGIWADATDNQRHIAWVREFSAAVQPFTTGGVYVNFLGNEGQDRVRAAYGPVYDRLVTLKRKYDPDNFFHHNQNIPPG